MPNVSVISKPDHPLGDSRGFARSHCPGVEFSHNFFSWWLGVLNLRNILVLKKKYRNFSICFKQTGGSLKKQVSLCCFISTFAKTVDIYCISLITCTIFGHFGNFDKIFRLFKVIFANARSS